MDWKGYEREIEQQFRNNYPLAVITPNAKLVGKFPTRKSLASFL